MTYTGTAPAILPAPFALPGFSQPWLREGPPVPIPERCLIHYDRRHDGMVRLTLKGVTNHELREVIVGLWARLDAEDRADHVNALYHYERVLTGDEPGFLSAIAEAIRQGPDGERAVNLRDLPTPEGS